MEQREEVNIKAILRASRMGMWRVEMEEGKPPRFYADEVMDEFLRQYVLKKKKRRSDAWQN